MKRTLLSCIGITIVLTAITNLSCKKTSDTPGGTEGSVFTPPPVVSNDSIQYINVANSDFENGNSNWKIKNDPKFVSGDTTWGIRFRQEANGNRFLNFYAPQPYHTDPNKPGWKAPDWTPWNGSALQTISGLADGVYTLQCQSGSAGMNMFMWANGGNGADSVALAKDFTTTSLDFVVKGGTVTFGIKCVNADAPNKEENAPWFNVDYFALGLRKP